MMKRTLTAAAMAAVLASPAYFAGSALAQSSNTDQMSKPSMSEPSTPSAQRSAQSSMPSAKSDSAAFMQNQNATDWRGSKLIGTNVYGADNASIGDINDVLIGNDGKINAVVIGVGGFLGVGQKNVAVPFDRLDISRKADSGAIEKVTVSYTKADLKSAPEFAYYQAPKTETTGSALRPNNAYPATRSNSNTK